MLELWQTIGVFVVVYLPVGFIRQRCDGRYRCGGGPDCEDDHEKPTFHSQSSLRERLFDVVLWLPVLLLERALDRGLPAAKRVLRWVFIGI